jgi:hypothetical protein
MKNPQINWYHEAIRIVPLIIMFSIFLATVDKNIALNQASIDNNQVAIEKVMTNHLPHINAKIDKLADKQSEMLEVVYDIKSLVK